MTESSKNLSIDDCQYGCDWPLANDCKNSCCPGDCYCYCSCHPERKEPKQLYTLTDEGRRKLYSFAIALYKTDPGKAKLIAGAIHDMNQAAVKIDEQARKLNYVNEIY